jgi:hypothetical protein
MRRVLFRIASVLIVLLDLGHTAGYPWSDPAWGVDPHALQSGRFNVLGSNRSYWDFYVGFGLSVSVLLLLPAMIAWQLGTPDARRFHGIAWFLVAVFAAMTILDCVFFFVIPIAFAGAITLCLAAAAIASPSTRLKDSSTQ